MYNSSKIFHYTENHESANGLFATAKVRYSNFQNDYFIFLL